MVSGGWLRISILRVSRCHRSSHLEGRNDGTNKEAAVTHINQDREMFGHLFDLDNIHVFILIHHGHRVASYDVDIL